MIPCACLALIAAKRYKLILAAAVAVVDSSKLLLSYTLCLFCSNISLFLPLLPLQCTLFTTVDMHAQPVYAPHSIQHHQQQLYFSYHSALLESAVL
jgi:hypothetical protein